MMKAIGQWWIARRRRIVIVANVVVVVLQIVNKLIDIKIFESASSEMEEMRKICVSVRKKKIVRRNQNNVDRICTKMMNTHGRMSLISGSIFISMGSSPTFIMAVLIHLIRCLL